MTTPAYLESAESSAWQQYLTAEHAARDHYLRLVQRAHLEYLTGPWPDRPSYETFERTAWLNYYAAGRDAWRAYRTAVEAQMAVPRAPRLASCGHPANPDGECDCSSWPERATFTPRPEREQ